MRKLSVQEFGTKVQGVWLKGDRRNPEPETFRVILPGGDIDVVRTSDDDYWIHVRVNVPGRTSHSDATLGKIIDARLDIAGKHASDCDEGDFSHPDLYHLAVRVASRRGHEGH